MCRNYPSILAILGKLFENIVSFRNISKIEIKNETLCHSDKIENETLCLSDKMASQ